MKIFLIGSTGATGHEVLKRLLKENNQVKVLVRNQNKLNLKQLQDSVKNQVELIEGSIFDLDILHENTEDCDAIISTIGTGNSNNYTEIYSKGGKNILSAMRKNEIKRLITITSGLIDFSDPNTDNFFLNRIIRPNFNKVYYDQTRWETILDETLDINWTCVRPTYLNNKPFTGKYRVKNQHCPKGGRKISRSDLAHFIVEQLNSGEYIQEKPVIAY